MKTLKKVVLAAMAILVTVSLTACGTKSTTGQDINSTDIVKEVGIMLTLTATDDTQQAIVNDSGMNGTGGRIHLHSNLPEDMYKGNDTTFVFDIGHIEKLGELYIWNYNAAGDTASGLKEVTISVSEDNVSWTEGKDYTLAEANGEDGLEATNQEDGTSVDFEGQSARYIKLEAKSNFGGDGYGLSELRLYRYKQPIVEGESISCSPLERYNNNKWTAKPEHYNFVNGAGLNDFRSAEAVHDNLPEHMYAQEVEKAFDFVVDLKGEYPVSKLVFWNYNDPEHLDWGLKSFRLKISDDYNIWKTIGTYELPQADGSGKLAPSLVIDLEDIPHAHYVQMEVLDNYGGEMVGLSEVSAFLGSGWYCDAESDYTALFSRYEGWAGADGIYTVNLDGKDYDYDADSSEKKTFFIFSDTIVSDVNPVTKIRSQFRMPNNTSALLTGKKPVCKNITFRWPDEEATASIVPDKVIPATKQGKQIYYWLGDTFVLGDKLYVFCLRIDSVNTGLGFEQVGVDLAYYDIKDGEVDYDSLTIINDEEMHLCDVSDFNTKWYMGGAVYQSTEEAGVMNPDGWVYIYGYQDVQNVGRELIVSRVKPENIEDFSKFEYLDEAGEWVANPPKIFKALAHEIAPEVSITQIQSGADKGKFLFVNTHITNSPTLKAAISSAPYEVFENSTTIYTHDTCLTTVGTGNNSYNAKAHPVLSTPKETIISYNVNGNDCFKYADIYRPRFLRLAMVADRK